MPLLTIRSRGHPDDRDRVLAAAGQAGALAADRRAVAPVEIADDRRRIVVRRRQGQRVSRDHVEARQGQPVVELAALAQNVGEDVELRQHRVEAQSAGR